MAIQQQTDELSSMKASQRTSANKFRKREHEVLSISAGVKLAEAGLEFLNLNAGLVVSGYFPYRTEINIMPLMERLAGEGMTLAFPVVIEAEQPLVFRSWAPGEETEMGSLNIPTPVTSAPEVEPDVLLVPLLAFDDQGYRLGYGGGFYDRTLEKLRAKKTITAIGVAYSGQKVGAVVRDVQDQPVDWMLTENGPMRPQQA